MKKCLSILLLICAALTGCSNKATRIGIINGADGPTAIYVTSSINEQLIAIAVVIAVIAVLIITYLKKRNKQRDTKQ